MARQVLTQQERALKKTLKLDSWAKKDFRQRDYFQTIDIIFERLTTVTHAEPNDRAVVNVLAMMVAEDGSVEDHVLRRNVKNPDWHLISLSCAGTLMETYLRRKDEGKWPVAN